MLGERDKGMGWSVLFFKKKEEGNHAYKVKFEHEMYK